MKKYNKVLSQYAYRVDEKAKDYDPNLKVDTSEIIIVIARVNLDDDDLDIRTDYKTVVVGSSS